MKINEIPFFRDNGWIFMPIAYLALIALIILIYFNINSSHHNSSYNVGSVDDVTINEIVTEKKAIYKFSETTSREYLQVSNVVNTKNIDLLIRETNLQDLKNPFSFYLINSEGSVRSVGYFGYNEDDCNKLKAISISKLGTHSISKVDNGISETLTWKSDDFNYVFVNKYLSDGIQLGNFCSYIAFNK
jgi:hypothetical protein